MHQPERTQARLTGENNLLVMPSAFKDTRLIEEFCGTVIITNDLSADLPGLSGKTLYFGGDVSALRFHDLSEAERVFVIRELSHGFDKNNDKQSWTLVDAGRIPMLIHGAGVYYRRFFNPGIDYFKRISAEHEFQSLTESTKPGTAHRTGIYLTPVEAESNELHFRLLRCSTNLSGPTENFRETDRQIVEDLNREAAAIFLKSAPLNHVLAQIYYNTPAAGAQKQSKAKISAHADKTKDMPANGIMAFCTFYDNIDRLQPLPADPFDYGYQGMSGLTRLHFRLKEPPADVHEDGLPAQFTITLYPDSVFFMPLSTNRLYTHEIRSSGLEAGLIPTRLGYVVRCSNAEAVHAHGQTFLKLDGNRVELEPPTIEEMSELRRLYAEENKTQAVIDYGDNILFSMNTGDYLAPRK